MTLRLRPCLVGLAIAIFAGRTLVAGGVAAPSSMSLQLAVSSGGAVTVIGRRSCGPGTTCSISAAEGTVVTLKASPAPHFSFAGWSGACVGLAPQCLVSLVSRLAVKANFLPSASIAVAAITGLGKVEADTERGGLQPGLRRRVRGKGRLLVRMPGRRRSHHDAACRRRARAGFRALGRCLRRLDDRDLPPCRSGWRCGGRGDLQGFVPAPPTVTAILGPPVTATTTTTTTTTTATTTTTTTPPHAAISLNVSPHTQTVNVDVNPTASFTILVENTGGVTLKNVDVVIDRSSCRLTLVPVLAPAASATYACTTANVLNLPHITVTVRASPSPVAPTSPRSRTPMSTSSPPRSAASRSHFPCRARSPAAGG